MKFLCSRRVSTLAPAPCTTRARELRERERENKSERVSEQKIYIYLYTNPTFVRGRQCVCKQKGLTCGPRCRCINCKNVLPPPSPNKSSPMEEPDQSLHFLSETEQSLLIGEEIELGHESDSNDSHSTLTLTLPVVLRAIQLTKCEFHCTLVLYYSLKYIMYACNAVRNTILMTVKL